MTKESRKNRVALVTSSLCAAALAAVTTQYFNTNAVSGQISTLPAPQAAPMSAAPTAPLASPATAVPATPTVIPATSAAPRAIVPAPTQSPAANADIEALRARLKTLQAQLQKMPTSLAEQNEQQAIYNELLEVQSQIQQQEAQAGQFAAYRMNRDREAALADSGLTSQAYQPQANGAFDSPDAMNPLASQRQQRQQALDASGLNSGSLYARTDAGAGLTPGEVAMLREQKEALTQQYRQIQQTLRALQPGDAALSDNLKQEQTNVLAQLREIDTRLNAAPQASLDAQALPIVSRPSVGVVPAENQLDMTPGNQAFNISARMQKVNQAASLLREAGLTQLADYASLEAPKLADPNYREVRLVPGNWAEGDGLAETRNNPFKQVGAKDIENINTKIDALKEQVETLSKTLVDVEAQLKLLTRNSVYTPEPAKTPTSSELVTEDDMAAAAAAATEEADTACYLVTPVQPSAPMAPDAMEDDSDLPPIPGLEELDAEVGAPM